jgi:hypothetical protein
MTPRLAVATYFVLMLVWILWIVDRAVFFGEPLGDLLVVIAIAGLHIATGLAVGTWWALFLPYALVLVAYPFGYPTDIRAEPPEIWRGLFAWSPVLVALLALGVAARRLGSWQGSIGVR